MARAKTGVLMSTQWANAFESAYRRFTSSKAPAALLAAAALALATPWMVAAAGSDVTQHSIVGAGVELNHVSVVVHDLAAVQALFRDRLGFNVQFGGRFPQGVENAGIDFPNHTYLEFLGVYDPAKAASTDVAAALKDHEGAIGVGLETDSAAHALEVLREHDISAKIETTTDADYDEPGEKASGTWIWREIDLPGAIPGGPFFIEYNRADQAARAKADPAAQRKRALERTHPNGALRLSAVWIAVHDLGAGVKAYQSLGLTSGPSVDFPELSATGRTIVAGTGRLLLLAPKPGVGPVADFLASRGEGIMGVTIEVADVARMRDYLRAHAVAVLDPRQDSGDRLLIGPPATPGFWLRLERAQGVN